MCSVFLLPFIARIAQLVEQLFSNQQVGGSDPSAGANLSSYLAIAILT